MLARTKLGYFCVYEFFIYGNLLYLLGMLVGDAMDDIVDELSEDEIMEEYGKLYLFLRYLDKQ
jgi:hypothetical protein